MAVGSMGMSVSRNCMVCSARVSMVGVGSVVGQCAVGWLVWSSVKGWSVGRLPCVVGVSVMGR